MADIKEGLLAIVICELFLTLCFAVLITAVGCCDDGGGGGGGGDGCSVDGDAACGFTCLH